jgi:DNA polymerase-3 subunit alpha (Gram-positive type)
LAIGGIALCAAAGLAFAVDHVIADPARTDQAISNTTFVFFDTETTGLSPKWHRILEIGAIKVRNGEVIETKSWLLNPQRSIPEGSLRVHGITWDMVKDKPTFAEIYPEFVAFIQDAVLVAHNARFDVSMVRAEIRRAGLQIPPNQVIDTLKLFRRWFPDAKSHRLGALADDLGVAGDPLHRAASDSMYDVLILNKGLGQKQDIQTLADLLSDAGGSMHF